MSASECVGGNAALRPADGGFWLSIVIPAFNEEQSIATAIAAVAGFASTSPGTVELIVVDDGSTDQTVGLASQAVQAHLELPVQIHRNESNRGKGAAVRQGVIASRGELVLICDADLSAPLEETRKLLAAIGAGACLAIGSRDMPDSVLSPAQPAQRRVLAWMFRLLRRAAFLPAIRDTQCGFKLLNGAVARELFAGQRTNGWLFDCELLVLADQRGHAISEIGIHWSHRQRSRVKVLPSAWQALADLWRIRRQYRRGRRKLE